MFDGFLSVQLAGILLKVHYPKLTFMHGVEHTVLLFFNDVFKIHILHQIISSQKVICNTLGSGIYHKPYSIFKSKYREIHNKNVGVFSGNDARMAGYFMGTHRYLRIRKVLQFTISSAECNVIPTKTFLRMQLGILMITSCGKGAMYFSR